MVVLERSAKSPRHRQEAELRVERTDISFHDVASDRVQIAVTVCNAGSYPSTPSPMRLESAPFGAFVPWRPLARLVVPELEPGESRELTTQAVRPRPAPLGDFNRVPPQKLLTALTSPDQPEPQPRSGFVTMLNLLRNKPTQPGPSENTARAPSLPSDLWDLVGRGQPIWAGNINVFIGARAVERHFARALRVYPGRNNLAMFLVGGPGVPDAYSFDLSGLGPEWKTVLYDAAPCRSLLFDHTSVPIKYDQWVESRGGLGVMLSTSPPVDCRTGNLEVQVTRRSCGTTAVVEFNLDPAAQGPGCYTV